MKLRILLIYFLASITLVSFGWWGSDKYKEYLNQDFELPSWNKPKPLEKYTIENLSQTEVTSVEVKVEDNIFSFEFDPTLEYKKGNDLKKVTGLINIPESNTKSPIVILLRGYVDQSIYQTGVGTKRVGEYFRDNGYITLAPDFLGYGGSSIESSNIFETRFQTYTTVLTLLKSINKENFPNWDGKNIFIWAHSNGGQIALTVLEITGKDYPTVLWAPVTENFPYSILYYTNESQDGGKFIRKELAKFEDNYDTDKFSLINYLEKINAPIEYHLGTADDAIPLEWRDRFLKRMKVLDKDITNYNHSGADHNMNPLWSEVILKTFQFLEKHKKLTT
ncbi:MAG: prolyl oligopeptidase family serine peptidase [bacterium]|nr:MAG: prolyl oligopeptidase family serine peptidase [bacterium]